MLTALFYVAAFWITENFFPFAHTTEGRVIPLFFIPITGVICGTLDGIISFISAQRISVFLVSPIIYTIIGCFAWWLAGILPWTKSAGGIPTTDGFMYVAITSAVVAGITSNLRKS